MTNNTKNKSDISRSTGYLIIAYLLSIVNQNHSIGTYQSSLPKAISILCVILSMVALVAKFYEKDKKINLIFVLIIFPVIIINLLFIFPVIFGSLMSIN